jgi:hypothetical protein
MRAVSATFTVKVVQVESRSRMLFHWCQAWYCSALVCKPEAKVIIADVSPPACVLHVSDRCAEKYSMIEGRLVPLRGHPF